MYVYENDRAWRKEFLREQKQREARPRKIRRKSMRKIEDRSEGHVRVMGICEQAMEIPLGTGVVLS